MNRAIWQAWDWRDKGEEWDISPAWKRAAVRRLIRDAMAPGGHILEIGPGAGRWTSHLLSVAGRLTGVDLSERCVRLCREAFPRKKADFFVNRGSDLDFLADRSVDAVWSFDVFVHINEREAWGYAQEFSRVLKAGGHGLVHHGSDGGRTGGWQSDLTQASFARLLRKSGLQVTRQFTDWEEGGHRFKVGRYGDTVTLFRKPG
jgi:ubiquinone/menaquinone biosynthesis C-methylase UbiE